MARPLVLVAGKDPENQLGGHATYVRAHALAARRAGYEPHLFCVGPATQTRETEFGVVHQAWSPFRPFRQVMVTGHAPLLVRAVERFALERAGAHLVHGFGLTWGAVGVLTQRRLARRGVRVVPVVSAYTTYRHESRGKLRGVRPHHGWRPFLRAWAEHTWTCLVVERYERAAYRGSAVVLINYESVRRLLVSRHGSGTECRRLPYTTDAAFGGFRPAPALPPAVLALRPADAPLVVALSRQDPRKGVDLLLAALADLRAAGVPFRACLVGGGRLLVAHRRLAERFGLEGQVALTGYVPDPRPYLRAADVFVLPSLQEGSGSLALIEALQAGLAVVAADLDGVPEDVTNGESALLVEPGRPDALTGALRTVLLDAPLRRRLAERGHQVFVRRFSADALVGALRDTYAGLGFPP